jgi:pyroglutamyl-peptidase I (EC:3.4.19.3). Cysteine peptidase. MEROPS family C15
MKVLVTGFDPFGGEKVNPAFEAVKRLEDDIAGAQIVKVEIPTVFKKSIEILDRKIEEEKPDIVICVGQAGGRFDMTIERVAINISDASIKDNEGNMPIDEKYSKTGKMPIFLRFRLNQLFQILDQKKYQLAYPILLELMSAIISCMVCFI